MSGRKTPPEVHAMVTMVLKGLWVRWRTIAHVIGNFQSRLILSIFYFVVLGPFGIGVQLFADPLAMRSGPAQWLTRPPTADAAGAATRQH